MPSYASLLAPRRAALGLVLGLALVAVLLWFWWPAGVLVGLVLGVLAVLAIGRLTTLQDGAAVDEELEEELGIEEPAPVFAGGRIAEVVQTAQMVRVAPSAEVVQTAQVVRAGAPDGTRGTEQDEPASQVRSELEHLKTELGDDFPDFTRAARLVVRTQYASAARLQRELALPYSRARRLLDDLERSHFVGPKTGSLPRQVLLPAERLPEMERLFAAA